MWVLHKAENSRPPSVPYTFAAALARRSIHDLDLATTGTTGTATIYIESRCEYTGKPTLWHQLDKRRFIRDTLGIQVEHLDEGRFCSGCGD